MSSVQVKLELGHRAVLREKVSEEGFTHDWTVFVRGPDSCSVQHFVEKVVFHLHKDFVKPKRVIKEPPYEVSESGYGSFEIPIEVYFKQKEDPKKVQFEYDLFLNTTNPTNHMRCEKLTFQNPTDDFRRKLLRGGAVGINNIENSEVSVTPHYPQRPSTPNVITGTLSSQSKDRKSASVAIKAPKSSTSSGSSSQAKETSLVLKPSESAKSVPRAPSPATKSFVDLFGQPINKTNKPSPDPQKIKNGQSKKPSSSSNQNKSSSSNSVKESKASGVKDTKSQVKEKIFSKRSQSPLLDSSLSTSKKRKRSITSSPSSHGSVKSGKDIDNKLSEKKSSGLKLKSEKKEKCSKERSVANNVEEVKSRKEAVSKSVKKLKQERALASSASPSLSTNSSVGSNSEINRSRETPQSESRTQYEGDAYGGGEESRSSTSSFSSVHQYKGSGPLGALMAELDDEQDGVLSPLSSDGSPSHKPEPPPPIATSENSAAFKHGHEKVSKSKTKEEKIKEPKSKKYNSNHHDSTNELNSSENKKASKKSNSGKLDPSGFRPINKAPRPLQFEFGEEYLTELQDLQRKIMLLKDRQHLQQIVNVIEETGQYHVTTTTFDFDLCRLDHVTVKKLQSCFMNI